MCDKAMNPIKYPISIKGVVVVNNQLVLLKNEREEWGTPRGRIEPGESPEDCLIREIKEELNITCEIDHLVDVWMYNIIGTLDVFIVT
ncbi:NUDIX domain-containing protein [Elizabethkingia argentiflava]|uniref:NUDIX domain-containing protein n=2 Tax=Elizabethkingia argenteiflava TaxID=2681556 RepID=A0A845PUH2_9FLAO|nr:NUDIX domain-containing protein [Elizabethkingia argenteiflava]